MPIFDDSESKSDSDNVRNTIFDIFRNEIAPSISDDCFKTFLFLSKLNCSPYLKLYKKEKEDELKKLEEEELFVFNKKFSRITPKGKKIIFGH